MLPFSDSHRQVGSLMVISRFQTWDKGVVVGDKEEKRVHPWRLTRNCGRGVTKDRVDTTCAPLPCTTDQVA